jgi:shikimate dehydrogenase
MKRLAVLGMPIAHSRSPAMHTAAFAALGIEREWSYEAIEVTPDRFEERVAAMPGEGFVGANVTVPHKGAALLVADQRSEVAREIGAANTLIFEGGEARAENTDAPGLIESLPEAADGKRALVLGAGGAARAVVWALNREGAEVWVWNRTQGRAAALCAELGGRLARDLSAGSYDVIVNATSIGMQGEDPFSLLPMQPGHLVEGQVVVDLVYAGESRLLAAAAGAGARTVDGLEVLVHQGAASFRIWTGLEPPIEAMREAARDA